MPFMHNVVHNVIFSVIIVMNHNADLRKMVYQFRELTEMMEVANMYDEQWYNDECKRIRTEHRGLFKI
jgi:hypothetical protein